MEVEVSQFIKISWELHQIGYATAWAAARAFDLHVLASLFSTVYGGA